MTERTPGYSGKKLAALLEAQGIRQDWLAARSGISAAQMSRIVRGSRNASEPVARRIADALRVPFSVAFELPSGSETLPIGSKGEAVPA